MIMMFQETLSVCGAWIDTYINWSSSNWYGLPLNIFIIITAAYFISHFIPRGDSSGPCNC